MVRKGVGGQTQRLKQLQHYYVDVFLEGALVFTKLRRARNNYGAKKTKMERGMLAHIISNILKSHLYYCFY